MLPEDIENTDFIYDIQKNIAFRTQVIQMTAPELIEHHERVQNTIVMGRQQELYYFMKNLQDNQYNTFFVYGFPGVGKTTFSIKAATYLLERQIFHIYYFIDLFGIRDRDMFRNKFN
jgi:DNA replication protein DnaC